MEANAIACKRCISMDRPEGCSIGHNIVTTNPTATQSLKTLETDETESVIGDEHGIPHGQVRITHIIFIDYN
jgi:hypothetical protein